MKEYCEVSFHETWVDVMFLIESTKWMTENGLTQVDDTGIINFVRNRAAIYP